MSGPRQDRGGRLHRSSASGLPNDPRLRRNAQGGTTDYEVGAGLAVDDDGRVEVRLDPKSGLFLTPKSEVALRVEGVLGVEPGSPYAVVMHHDGTLVENKKGELSAQPDFSKVRANSRETSGVTLKDVLDGEVELQKRKGAAEGYASLGATALVPTSELGTGVADATSLLFGDQTFKTAIPASAMTEVLALADLTDVTAKSGTGTTVVMDTDAELAAPVLTAPVIGDFTAAPHSHQNAAGAGSLDAAAIATGVFPLARIDEVLALGNLTDVSAKTGGGSTVVMDDTPTISRPTLTVPVIGDFASAAHTHQSAAGGGALDAAAIATGTLAVGRVDEVLALSNLSDVTAKTGTGTTVVMDTGPTVSAAVLTDAVPNRFRDSNGSVILGFNATPATTNWVEVTNAATLTAPTVAAAGADTNIDLNLAPKGVGNVRVGGEIVETRNAKNAASGYVGADVNGQVESSRIANKAVTWPKIQDFTETDVLFGRSTAGAGTGEEIPCTAAGRALIDDATAAAQRTTLGLGAVALLSTLSEQIALANLTDVTATTGTGSTVPFATSPVLTTPRIVTSIDDSTGAKLLRFTPAASAVNFLDVQNATALNAVALTAQNASAPVDLFITAENLDLIATTLEFNGDTIETQNNKGALSGYASLNGSALVVENPANATSTATASKIPIADGSAKLDTWISDASTTVKGKVELATSAEVTAGLAVQASDTRLSDSRAPNGAAGGGLSGTYPSPGVVAATTSAVGAVELATDGEEAASVVVQGNDTRLWPVLYTRREMQVIKDPGAATFTSVGTAAPTLSGTVTNVDGEQDTQARFQTGASSGNSAGMLSAVTVLRRGWDPHFIARASMGNTLTSYRQWVGLTSADLTGVATPTTQNVAAFRYDTGVDGTAFWRTVTNDGTGPATVTTTTVAVTTAFFLFRIVCRQTPSADVRFYIDNVLVATHTATLPLITGATSMAYQVSVTTLTAATRRMEIGRVAILHK